MEHSLERAVRSQLVSYLAGDVSLDDFKAWLVSVTWSLDVGQQPKPSRLVSQIKLVLAEHSGGFRTDEEMQHELITLHNASAIEAEVESKRPLVSTDSATVPIKSRAWQGLSSVFGEPRVVASAT